MYSLVSHLGDVSCKPDFYNIFSQFRMICMRNASASHRFVYSARAVHAITKDNAKVRFPGSPIQMAIMVFLLWPINVANVIFLKSAGGGDRSF